MRVVEDDRAGLHRLPAGTLTPNLLPPVKQIPVGARPGRLAFLELGREELLFDVGHRSDAVLAALGQNLIDELVGLQNVWLTPASTVR